MTLPTLIEILTEVDNALDLTDEIMVLRDEKVGYVNASVDEAEQHILAINEDYFLQTANLPLVAGEQDILLPGNIYAHKIRRVYYTNGGTTYEIKRIRNLDEIPNVDSGDDYRYLVYMDSSGGFRMKLYPASRESSSSNVSVWFIGNANRLEDDTDIMNIPEARSFVVASTKLACARKEGHPAAVSLEGEVERQRVLMVDSLQAKIPDENNQIEVDLSYFDDGIGGYF